MIQVVNNFLYNPDFVKIEDTIASDNFLWRINNRDPFILTHCLISRKGQQRSFFADLILNKLLDKLQTKIILESNITLYGKHDSYEEYYKKSEFLENKNYKTCLLHMNSNDGFTKIIGMDKIDCVENRAIITDTTTNFLQSNPKKNTFKTVLAVHYE